jgi:putative ABC transport system permease protein
MRDWLTQLPYRDPDRLVTIVETDRRTPNPQDVASGTVEEWKTRSRSFEKFSLWRDFSIRPIVNGQPEYLRGMRVNANFFDVLGVRMRLGRSFLPEEDRPDARNKLILSYGLWIRRFGGDRGVIGRMLPAVGASSTIVGVLPPDFHPLHMSNPGEAPELFAPLGSNPEDGACHACRGYRLIGRLKQGVTTGQAQAELNAIQRDLVREYPADYAQDASALVTPLGVHLIGPFRTALWVLLGAVGLLLLLASANVASLLLARATRRNTEIAVRTALGASRWRLARQMLTESLVLSLAGGAAGMALAWLATSAIAKAGAREIPRLDEIRPTA